MKQTIEPFLKVSHVVLENVGDLFADRSADVHDGTKCVVDGQVCAFCMILNAFDLLR